MTTTRESVRPRPTETLEEDWRDAVPLFLSQDYCWEAWCAISFCLFLGLTVFAVLGAFLVGPLAYEYRYPPTPSPPGPVVPPAPTPVPTPSPAPSVIVYTNNTGAPPITQPPGPSQAPIPTYAPIDSPYNTNGPPDLGPTYPKCFNASDCLYINLKLANNTAAIPTAYGCVGNYCTIVSCPTKRGNCDQDIFNGCESNLLTDPYNCNACDFACSFPHSMSNCSGGTCDLSTLVCEPLWGNCDGWGGNGCESNLKDDPYDCGVCGNECVAEYSQQVSSVYCRNSQCTIFSCRAGWGDCDDLYSTGCETPILNNNLHCGSCSLQCDTSISCCVENKCRLSAGQTITQPSYQDCIGQKNGTQCILRTTAPSACCSNVDCVNNTAGNSCNGLLGFWPFTNGTCGPP